MTHANITAQTVETTRPRLIVFVLALACLSAGLMGIIVIPLIPELPRLFNADVSDTSWVLTSALIAQTISMPIAGRLGDLYGKKRIVLILLALMGVGSLLAAVSASLILVIVGRALQGLAGGLIPLAISILRDQLPPHLLNGSVAIISATLGIGAAGGLPIAALVAQLFDFRALFWVSLTLATLGFLLVLSVVPADHRGHERRNRFDFAGAVGLSVGLVLFILALSKGATWGWASVGTLTCAALGALVLVLWGFHELRTKSPLVNLRLVSRGPVLLVNLSSLGIAFAFYGTNVLIPQLLQLPEATGVGFGLSMIISSLFVLPNGLFQMASAPVAARIATRFNARLSLVIGACFMTASWVFAIFFFSQPWHTLVVSIGSGIGLGLAYSSMPIIIMGAIPLSETASVNGVNALMRSLGTVFAAAVIGVVLAANSSNQHDVATPTHEAFVLASICCTLAALLATMFAGLIRTRKNRSLNAAESLNAIEVDI